LFKRSVRRASSAFGAAVILKSINLVVFISNFGPTTGNSDLFLVVFLSLSESLLFRISSGHLLCQTLILTLAERKRAREEGTDNGGGRKETYLLCRASVENILAASILVYVVLSETELKQLCLCLKHHFSNETDTEYSNITPDKGSVMQLAQTL
jgi:hypothetical protein